MPRHVVEQFFLPWKDVISDAINAQIPEPDESDQSAEAEVSIRVHLERNVNHYNIHYSIISTLSRVDSAIARSYRIPCKRGLANTES
jgi:hypothetical protein